MWGTAELAARAAVAAASTKVCRPPAPPRSMSTTTPGRRRRPPRWEGGNGRKGVVVGAGLEGLWSLLLVDGEAKRRRASGERYI